MIVQETWFRRNPELNLKCEEWSWLIGVVCVRIVMNGVWCVMPKSVYMMLKGWRRKPSSFRHRAWNLVPSCMWILRRERNRRTFEGQELSIVRVKLMFVSSLLHWLSLDAGKPKNIEDIKDCIFRVPWVLGE